MPIIDLMGAFNAELPGAPANLEHRVFYFDKSPEVHYVDDKGNVVVNYNDLPPIPFTAKEQAELSKLPDPILNDPQVVVKALKFDQEMLMLEAYKCDYKFVQAMERRTFSADSAVYSQLFFKAGVIAALHTNDEKTIIVERNDAFKLFSSFAGYLKADAKDGNVIITTALEEAS